VSEKFKICMVGATAVGKTSLASRFARGVFSDRYRTTIGVAIETRSIERGDRLTQLVIWDLSGEDEFQTVQAAYFRGAAGYLLVVDGTRLETIEAALALKTKLEQTVGKLPFVLAVNKSDIPAPARVNREQLEKLAKAGIEPVLTSAKTGAQVDDVFGKLVDAIHGARERPWT
jgi:small GTP-binding protein